LTTQQRADRTTGSPLTAKIDCGWVGASDVQSNHSVLQYQYDVNGNLIRSTDANGHATNYEYDALNRLLKTVAPSPGGSFDATGAVNLNQNAQAGEIGGPVTTYQHDNLGNLWSVTDALGNQMHSRYDDLNRPTIAVSPKPTSAFTAAEIAPNVGLATLTNLRGTAAVTTLQYSLVGNGWKTALTDPLGRTVEHHTDFLGRTTQIVAPPDTTGHRPTTAYEYFADNRLRSVRDPRDSRTEYDYDGRGRVKSVTGEDPGTGQHARPVTSYEYFPDNQVKSVTDPLNRVTTYEYDSAGRNRRMIAPDPATGSAPAADGTFSAETPVTSFVYDAVGNVLTVTDTTTTVSFGALAK
jgi:YD repeat-containing protein